VDVLDGGLGAVVLHPHDVRQRRELPVLALHALLQLQVLEVGRLRLLLERAGGGEQVALAAGRGTDGARGGAGHGGADGRRYHRPGGDERGRQLYPGGDAVRQAGGAKYGTITCLYRLVTRRGGFGDLPLKDDEAAAAARLRELVADEVELVDAGLFPRSTRGRCDYYDMGYACGVSAWTRARKREDAALAPVVRLQGPAAQGGSTEEGFAEGDCDGA
jgi:hypothetical protein